MTDGRTYSLRRADLGDEHERSAPGSSGGIVDSSIFVGRSMTDVFISYAREDREAAQRLAAALEARGWSVWWDREIPVGHSFDQVIEQQLEAAKSVVVLWSKDSAASEWVKSRVCRRERGADSRRSVG